MTKMIPPVHTSAVMMPTPKQKIGFSIESIVGNDASAGSDIVASQTASSEPANNRTAVNLRIDLADSLSTNNNSNSAEANLNNSSSNGPTSPPQTPPANYPTLPSLTHSTLLAGGPAGHLPSAHHLTLVHQQALQHHLFLQQQQQHHQHLQQQHQHQQQQQQQQQQLKPDISDIIQRLHNSAAAAVHLNAAAANGSFSPTPTCLSPDEETHRTASNYHLKRDRSPSSAADSPAQRHQPPHTPPKSVSPQSSHPSTPPPPPLPSQSGITSTLTASSCSTHSPQSNSQYYTKPTHTSIHPSGSLASSASGVPLLVPGIPPANIVRPFPVGPVVSAQPPPPPPPPNALGNQPQMPDIKALPPYINAPPELPAHQHNPHLLAAAQFQMAAALQAGHVLGPAAAAAAAAGIPPHAAPFMGPAHGIPRDSYPLYPWLLSRHGRIFPHRFPGNFLLQPFRKPKRIRTAFSPSQLLKLEHAFENNQYVVGAERKALAQSLNLSETQVKVWFQNRRTKHKRMQQEDEKGGSSSNERSSQNANTSCDEDEDELIDMEMDDCPSDDEHDQLDASH